MLHRKAESCLMTVSQEQRSLNRLYLDILTIRDTNCVVFEHIEGVNLTISICSEELFMNTPPIITFDYEISNTKLCYNLKIAETIKSLIEATRIERVCKDYVRDTKNSILLKCKIIGPDIDNNYYNLKEHKLYISSILDCDEDYTLNLLKLDKLSKDLGLYNLVIPSIPHKLTNLHIFSLKGDLTSILDNIDLSKSKVNPNVGVREIKIQGALNPDIFNYIINLKQLKEHVRS